MQYVQKISAEFDFGDERALKFLFTEIFRHKNFIAPKVLKTKKVDLSYSSLKICHHKLLININ